ncbi:MAG: hypothetical protein RLZZ621_20 [Gemmatimonadota bacterium]|jgi:hypothetical protein
MPAALKARLARARDRVRRRLRAEAEAVRSDATLAQGGLAFLIAYAIMYAVGALGIG